jgi:hypothetical protein
MTAFRALLIIMILVVLSYTGIVIATHGLGFIPVFFGDIKAMGWSGQFNLDFSGLLVLSGLWLAWRHQFSPAGLALGSVCSGRGHAAAVHLLALGEHEVQGKCQRSANRSRARCSLSRICRLRPDARVFVLRCASQNAMFAISC